MVSDTAFSGAWSGSALFTYVSGLYGLTVNVFFTLQSAQDIEWWSGSCGVVECPKNIYFIFSLVIIQPWFIIGFSRCSSATGETWARMLSMCRLVWVVTDPTASMGRLPGHSDRVWGEWMDGQCSYWPKDFRKARLIRASAWTGLALLLLLRPFLWVQLTDLFVNTPCAKYSYKKKSDTVRVLSVMDRVQ